MEVEQQIGLAQHVPGGGVGPVEPLDRSIVAGVPRAVAARVQEGAVAHAEALHPLAERRERPQVAMLTALDLLQPIHVATEAPQALHVLHVHPEMPGSVGKTHHVEWRYHHGRHGSGRTSSRASNQRSTSAS